MSEEFTPVFIGGTGRSGTTITLNLLHRHSTFHASLPREIKYLTDRKGLIDFTQKRRRSYENVLPEIRNHIAEILLPFLGKSDAQVFSDRIYGRWWNQIGKTGNPRGLIQGMEIEELDTAIKHFLKGYKKDRIAAARAFYFEVSRAQIKQPGIRFFGDSTPINIMNSAYIYKLFPTAKFINLVRDGRDVALSVSRERWGPNDIQEALPWWGNRILKGAQGLDSIPENQKLELRLENLVTHEREKTFKQLLNFLGLEEDPTIREYFDSKLLPEKMMSGQWRDHVPDAHLFDKKYQLQLDKLSQAGISVEKFY